MSHFESLLNRTYTLARRVRVSDGQGGWPWSYVDQGTIQGRLRPASGAERMAAQQEQRAITHVFYCLYDEDIRRTDQLVGDGVTVYVDAVRKPSRMDHHLEVDCSETQVEGEP